MEAVRLKKVDRQYEIHLQAWLTFAAKATKGKKGQPVYKMFERFFNYEKELEKARKPREEKPRFSGIGKFLKKGG